MGCYRVVFNRALAFSKKTGRCDAAAFTEMGKRFVASRNIQEDWLRDCPQVIRSVAIRDLKAAFSSNFEKRKKNPGHRFDIRFKSKKEPLKAVRIETKNAAVRVEDGRLSFFPTKLRPMRFDARALKGLSLDYDVTISKDKLGRFSLHVPLYRENQPEKEAAGWCAVDPGVRTFLTTYSLDAVNKIGQGAATRLFRLCRWLDDLLSRITKTTGRQRRWRMRRAAARMRLRITNLVRELHWQAAAYLTHHYTDIALPVFETQRMARRLSRKLTSEQTRRMLTLSHYTFRQRLQHKAAKEGCRVHMVGEEFTSKTCTRCGFIKHNLQGAEVFRCNACGLRIDRDIGGGRNIALKNYAALLVGRPAEPLPR